MTFASKQENEIIGFSSIQFYVWLLNELKTINRISLLKFNKPPKLQDRLKLNDVELDIINIAKFRYKLSEMSFWDIVFSVCIENKISSGRLFKQAIFHQKVNESPIDLTPLDFQEDYFHKLIESINSNQVLAISSEVSTTEGIKHIPMMDFHCSISKYNLSLVKLVCENIFNSELYILKTDRSYHACGVELVSHKEWLDFMAKGILYGGVVDRAYIAHQIIEQKGCLRISKGNNGNFPTVIAGT